MQESLSGVPGRQQPPRPRVLLIAEAANSEWVSVPLVGWSHARALREVADVHIVTQTRNVGAFERAGLVQGRDFTAIDSEAIAKPAYRFGQWLRRTTGLGWTTTSALSGLSYYLFEAKLWQAFGARIERGDYDIVHRLTPLTPTTPSIIARRCAESRVPFVLGPLNGGAPWPSEFRSVLASEGEWLSYVRDAHRLMPGYRSTRECAAAIVIASQATWQAFAGYHDKCVYVPENGIDPARFQRTRRASEHGPLRAAFVGRLVPYKGADMLIEAAAPLVRSRALELSILGDGPQLPALHALVRREGLQHGVELAGWVEHAHIQERLLDCHAFAFPSIREFGGGVVLEAMTLGLPPIVVDYAGPSELVTDRTGYRVALGSRPQIIARFRDVLSRLSRDRSELAPRSEAARARVLAHFTWEAKARQMFAIYAWVLGRGAKPDFGMPFPDDATQAPGVAN